LLSSQDSWLQVALLAWGLVFLLLLVVGWLLFRPGLRSRDRNRRAQRGEHDAERLLEKHGFSVIERQARRRWTVRVDGEDEGAEVRADLLVQKDGLLFVAEVKTGDLAVDPLFPATRRQLLEYFFVFEPDGLLLVDPEASSVVEVEFPDLQEPL
jgi:hypothetical protein